MTIEIGGLPVAGLASQAVTFFARYRRSIADEDGIAVFTTQVVLRESHLDELDITDHPVDMGARISDHAFKRPREVTIEMGWSNSPSLYNLLDTLTYEDVRDVYQRLLDLQVDRLPIIIETGKVKYENMLLKRISTVTTKESENGLFVTALFREIIRVAPVVVDESSTDAAVQEDPEETQAPIDTGGVQTVPYAEPPDGLPFAGTIGG